MKWLKSVALILLLMAVFVVTIPAVNQQEMPLRFAIWETPFALSNFWWLLGAFLIGLTVGLLNSLWSHTKHRLQVRKLRQTLAQTEAEVERLRSLSI
jgi:uncharacterized membrane protein YciS (DUF1049 family)